MDKLDHTYTLPTDITTVINEILDEVRDQDHIKHIIIPQGVTSIKKGAFFKCTSLTSVVIPNRVTRIYQRAFLIYPRQRL